MRILLLALVACAVAVLPAWTAPPASSPDAAPLSLSDYVARLETLRSHLEAGSLDEARAVATRLSTREVSWADERLTPDPTVLEDVRRVSRTVEARSQAARIRRLVEALRCGPGLAEVHARPEVLSRLTHGADLAKGGETPQLRVKPLTLPERVETSLLAVADWIGDALRKIGEWLRRLVPPRPKRTRGDVETTAAVAVTFAMGAVALLAILAVRTLRRARRGPVEAVRSRMVSSSRDEDPLSREVDEWETYARELGAKRRWREAIRAWYHAVLVALFRSGLLHHQRGRTNWEYVSSLPPDLGWRPRFVSLTRHFDQEWYGRRRSSSEALSDCAREARELLGAVRGAGGAG